MEAVTAAFNQEKALEGAFSVIVLLRRLIVNSTNIYLLSAAAAPAPAAVPAGAAVALAPQPQLLLGGGLLLLPGLHLPPPLLHSQDQARWVQMQLSTFNSYSALKILF